MDALGRAASGVRWSVGLAAAGRFAGWASAAGVAVRRCVVWRRIVAPRAVTEDVGALGRGRGRIGAGWFGSAWASSGRRRGGGLGHRRGAAARRVVQAAATVRAGTRV